MEGATCGVEVAMTAGAVGAAVDCGAIEGETAIDGATEGVGRGLMDGDGRVRGDSAGVGLGAALATAAGVALGDGRVRGDPAGVGLAAALAAATGVAVGDGRMRGDRAGDGLTAALAAAAGVAVAAALAAGEAGAAVAVAFGENAGVGLAVSALCAGVAGAGVAAVSRGFTNLFGGALGGGVASVRIFVRARSAAERSAISVHPLSTFTSTTRSRIRRGRGISRTSVMRGAETSSSSPRSRAGAVSELRCQRRCTRGTARWLRERSSS